MKVLKSNTYLTSGTDWYKPVLAGAGTLQHFIFNKSVYSEYMRILKMLQVDDYAEFLNCFIEKGLKTYGHYWKYADICTTLLGLSKKLQPRSYLEIGVRRGRSMAMLASQCPSTTIVGFDMWQQNYAGMENPGPQFVKTEIQHLGHTGTLELISGNSHNTVPAYLDENQNMYFDFITVDGDHTEKGAALDLETVLPRLAIGGVIIFDDIVHPKHPYLIDVWNSTVKNKKDLSTFEFTELGYGVAFGIKIS